jgi:hypothetical protein
MTGRRWLAVRVVVSKLGPAWEAVTDANLGVPLPDTDSAVAQKRKPSPPESIGDAHCTLLCRARVAEDWGSNTGVL